MSLDNELNMARQEMVKNTDSILITNVFSGGIDKPHKELTEQIKLLRLFFTTKNDNNS
ncbi:MAG: hypothetical protein KAH77_04300 [Thiomargarita sp.]|nr:hypothetical protein [Thiomargarita sp.]